MGRKLTLTKKIQDQIVKILEAGNYQKTAYESLGINENTYFKWIQAGEKAQEKEGKLTKSEQQYLQFLQAIKKAIQASRQFHVKIIKDSAQKGNWQASAWFLERTAYEEFGRKERQEHTGKDGKDLVFRIIREKPKEVNDE